MNFISQNIFLIAIAVISGSLLLWTSLVRGRGGMMLGTLEATQIINQKEAQVVDLRSDSEFRAGHLPGARQVAADRLQTYVAGLDASRPVLLVCTSGMQAGKAANALKAGGRAEVYTLEGGINAWRQAGLPLVK